MLQSVRAIASDRKVNVEIKCFRHEKPEWRPFCKEPLALSDARRLVERHKEIDQKTPIGHYAYRILELDGKVIR